MSFLSLNIKGDRGIWAICLLFSLISLLVVYSSIVTLAYKHQQGNTFYYLFRHGVFLTIGLGIIYYVHKINYKYLSKLSIIFLVISIPLLLFTLLFGANKNEASRWLMIPIINQTFQTSDFAKLALIMYVSRVLSLKQHQTDKFKEGFLPVIIPVVLVCACILPANFSTAALLFSACMLLMFIARIHWSFLIGTAAVGIIAASILVFVIIKYPTIMPRAATWNKRIESFKTGESKDNYQAEQSKIAIATGGLFGKGPGKSTQRNFLPHPYSDFIFAIVMEEYGLLGGVFVLFLYIIFLFRSIRIMHQTDRIFGKLLVAGISFLLVFQALVNMAVAVNLFPVTGQPLPMISMGGTSMWFTCLSMGIILSVSHESEKREELKLESREE